MSDEFGIHIGKAAIARRFISQEQARHCFQLSQSHGRSFSDTALSLGYLSRDQIQFLINQIQQERTVLDQAPQAPAFHLQTTVQAPPSQLLQGSDSDARTIRIPPSSFPPSSQTPSKRSQTQTRSQRLQEGEIFDGYTILSLLGQGGMGAVYKVEKQGKISALKVITTDNMKAEARFEREAGAAMSVSGHPNIVGIEGYTKFGEQPYLVMEFVEGRGLDEVLTPGQPYDPDETAELAEKIASALSFVHGKGIFHRDLKPANILIRQSDGEPLITDFGLAKLVDYETMTRTADWLGTPAYMSPEQAGMDHKEVDSSSDTWALGVILYEMSTGQRPFQANEIYQLINLILEKNPARPSTLNPRIDPNLETIILKALNKEKSHRYSDARELAKDIAKLGTSESVEGYIEGSMDEIGREVKKKVGTRMLRFAVLATIALSLSIGAYFYIERQKAQSEERFEDIKAHLRDYQKAIASIQESEIFRQCALEMAKNPELEQPKRTLQAYQSAIIEARTKFEQRVAQEENKDGLLRILKLDNTLAKLDENFAYYRSLIQPDRTPENAVVFEGKRAKLIQALRQYKSSDFKGALKTFKIVAQENKDDFEVSLAIFGSAQCQLKLNQTKEACDQFASLSTRTSLGGLGEQFYVYFLGMEAIEKLTKKDERNALKALKNLSKRLSNKTEDARKTAWRSWNERFQRRYISRENLTKSMPLRVRQWLFLERMNKNIPQLEIFSADFKLSKALGEHYARKYRSSVDSKSSLRFGYLRKAIYYHLNAFLKDRSYKAADGYHAPQLGDFVSVNALPGKSSRERELAFQVLLDASRLGLYIPTFQGTLRHFIELGFFEQAIAKNPEDPYLLFWRGSGAVSYYTALWNEKKIKLKELLDIIDRSANDLDIVYQDPSVPSYFRAIAADRWVATRRFKEDIAKGRDPTINTDEWRKRLRDAIAMNSHPKADNLYQSLYHLTGFEDMAKKVQLVDQRMAVIKDRRRRTLMNKDGSYNDEKLYEERPVGCPMGALIPTEFDRLVASTQRLYAECYKMQRNYKKVIEAAKISLEFEKRQGPQDLEETTASYLLDAYLATESFKDFDQFYKYLKTVEAQYKKQGNSKLDWIAKLKKYKVMRDQRGN